MCRGGDEHTEAEQLLGTWCQAAMVEPEPVWKWRHSAEKPFIHSLTRLFMKHSQSPTLKDVGLNSGDVQLKRFHGELGQRAMRGGS